MELTVTEIKQIYALLQEFKDATSVAVTCDFCNHHGSEQLSTIASFYCYEQVIETVVLGAA